MKLIITYNLLKIYFETMDYDEKKFFSVFKLKPVNPLDLSDPTYFVCQEIFFIISNVQL